MKWLKHAGELRKNELEKSRAEILDQFKKIEKQSPECAIAVKLEFRTLTHDVCTLFSFSAVAYS